ncbi:MAG: hypothetical protein LC745_01655 [Planctomycetia bacterium]|nr:hypothetical protein [Planctomycetia bacterium]
MARTSTSRKRETDWSGIASSLSRRCSRQGEWTSSTGTPNTQRQGRPATQRPNAPRIHFGRRPTTWSQRSIASSNGSRCSDDHVPTPLLIRTSGAVAPCTASSITVARPNPSALSTTTDEAPRSLNRISAAIDAATSPARTRPAPPSASTITKTDAPGSGSRRMCSS